MVLEMCANIILPENGPIWHQLRNGDLDGVDFGHHSPMMIDFVKSILQPSPSLRPTADDLLKHPRLFS